MTSVDFTKIFASDFSHIVAKHTTNKFNPGINKGPIGYTSNLSVNTDTRLENLRTINCSCDFQPQDSHEKYTINIELFYVYNKLQKEYVKSYSNRVFYNGLIGFIIINYKSVIVISLLVYYISVL